MAQYGSADSGASLGDILGAALKQRDDKTEDKAETEKAGNRPTAAGSCLAKLTPGLDPGVFLYDITLPKAGRIPSVRCNIRGAIRL